MSLDLPENMTIRAVRLELAYSAARLSALPETRHLAKDFEEAADKFALLEEEEGRLDIQRVETQAMVETADDAWDATMLSLHRRLLDMVDRNTDHELYRRYFADIPSHVTSLSYAAEILISKDLEASLSADEQDELRSYAERLESKRGPLEAALRERTRLEVEVAKFANRVALAKALGNKLRRMTAATLEELAASGDREAGWARRFFRGENGTLGSMDRDGVDNLPSESLGAS